jgi:hypothetical protein
MNLLNMTDGIHKFGMFPVHIRICVMNMQSMLINVEIIFMLNLLGEKVQ